MIANFSLEAFTLEQSLTWIRASSWLVASIGGSVAAFKAIFELRENRFQKERELRFKQAEAGKKLLDELFDDKEAMRALNMLDFNFMIHKDEDGNGIPVNRNEIPEAIQNIDGQEDPKTVMIVRSFDALFYCLNLFEHFIEVGLTKEEDLAVPMEYYAKLLAENKSVYVEYIRKNTYLKSLSFLNRFSDWRES